MTGLFLEVHVDHLVVGHTKYSPDRMFGWMSSILRMADYFSKFNMEHLFAKRQQRYAGTIVNEMLEWTAKLEAGFKQIKCIKKLQTFKISKKQDGSVEVIGATSHLPDATTKAISFQRGDVQLSQNAPNTHISKKPLPAKLLEALKTAQKYVLGPERIEYVPANE